MKIIVNGEHALNFGGVISISEAMLLASETLGIKVEESDVELKCLSTNEVRVLRDKKISSVTWRLERNAREIRLGIEPTDSLEKLDIYMQALADLTIESDKKGADKIAWPDEP